MEKSGKTLPQSKTLISALIKNWMIIIQTSKLSWKSGAKIVGSSPWNVQVKKILNLIRLTLSSVGFDDQNLMVSSDAEDNNLELSGAKDTDWI